MNKRLIHVAVALAVLPAALLAQESSAPAPSSVEAAASATDQTEGSGVTGQKGKETLSVDFPNAEIRTILRNIADLFDLNLVIPETLEGRASLKLREVTWRQIFDVLLQPIGYTYVVDGNIIKVVSKESLEVEAAETRVYVLNYARASDIAPTVTSMIDPVKGGKLQIDSRSNALVVTERPKRHEQIGVTINTLDHATEQVMIETKFVDVTAGDDKNVGLNWANLNNYSFGTSGEITSDAASVSSFPTATAPGTLVKGAVASSIGTTLRQVFHAPQIVNATFSADEFRGILSFLQNDNNARLVSNPTVVTLNNVEATINVGEEYPIPNYTYNQERGAFEVSGFEYKPIGIILKVTPQVNAAGFIKLLVEPTVSSRNAADVVSFGSATIPIIKTKTTKTQVSLKDGYTMGIGGLMETTKTKTGSKVPFLGDIPVLGAVFKSKGETLRTHNLVIFITAKTIDAAEPKIEKIFDSRMIRSMEIKRDELPGYRSSEPAFDDAAPPVSK